MTQALRKIIPPNLSAFDAHVKVIANPRAKDLKKSQAIIKKNFGLFTKTEANCALSISEEKMKNLWCLDSGGTRHICNND